MRFGSDIGGLIGNLEFLGLQNVTINGVSGEIPEMLFICFQMMFACLTLAILSSGVVGRIKMSVYLIFGAIWLTLVYSPLAQWA